MFSLLLVSLVSAQEDGCNQNLDLSSIARIYGSNLLSSECPADVSSPFSFCYVNASAPAGVAVAGVVLNSAFVVRSVTLAPIDALNMPTMFKLQAVDNAGASAWYVDPGRQADGGSWTLLTSSEKLTADFDLSSFEIFPITTVETASQELGFVVSVQGCPDSATVIASLTFETTIKTIQKRFATTTHFIEELRGKVCMMLGLAVSCRQVLPSSVTESEKSWSSGTPATPKLQVNFRILPPAENCQRCSSPQELVARLESDLSDVSTLAAQVMTALQNWVQDDSPFMCGGKSCPFGQQCFSGVCIDPSTITVSAIASGKAISSYAPSPSLVLADLAVDATLSLPQLALISGAPVPNPSLQFTKQADESKDAIQHSSPLMKIIYISVGAAGVAGIGVAVWFFYFH